MNFHEPDDIIEPLFAEFKDDQKVHLSPESYIQYVGIIGAETWPSWLLAQTACHAKSGLHRRFTLQRQDNRPSAMLGRLGQGRELPRQRLPVMGRTSVRRLLNAG